MDLRLLSSGFFQRFSEVEAALNDPKVFENNQRFQDLSGNMRTSRPS